MNISKKRIIGSALFGLLIALYLRKAFDYSIPVIISSISHLSLSDAADKYQSSSTLHLLINTVYIFFGAGIAAFLAKTKGVLVGILSSLLIILAVGYLLVNAITTQDTGVVSGISYQLFLFIQLLLMISASIFGGYYGQKIYSEDIDLDIGKNKLTLFGIRWPHYFWIMPLILYPFFASFVIIIYAIIIFFLSYFYIGIHPSLWGYLFSIVYFLIPIGVYFSAYLTIYAFGRFFELMQYGQSSDKGWKRFGKVLLFGLIVPIVTYFIASYAAELIHNLPTPAKGDWKIGLYIFLGFYGIFGLFSIYNWLKERVSQKSQIV
jgi:hypothetical protein